MDCILNALAEEMERVQKLREHYDARRSKMDVLLESDIALMDADLRKARAVQESEDFAAMIRAYEALRFWRD